MCAREPLGVERPPNFPRPGGKEVSAMDIAEIIIYMITFIVLLIVAKDSRPRRK